MRNERYAFGCNSAGPADHWTKTVLSRTPVDTMLRC